MPNIWRKSGGTWRQIKTVYRKTGGSWQSVKKVWRKTSGVWQLVFQSALTPSIQTRVSISSTTLSDGRRRIDGVLYHWLNATGVTYRFARSTDGISYTNITGASGTSTNPASGGTNTSDRYTVTQSDVTPNTTNYYIYISTATNSTFGTEQTSTSEFPISIDAPRNLTLSNSKTSSSITISWSNDIYSGRYEYQWKLNSSSTWSTSIFLAPGTTTTSFTRTGLTASMGYDFRVRGWTGSTDNNGYFGNWAEALNISTNALGAPNAPINLTTNTISKDSFFLQWQDPTGGEPIASYDYGVSTSNTVAPATLITGTTGSDTNPSNNQYKNIAVADTNKNQLIDELSSSTDYYGWVRTKNAGGSSSWAVSAKVTTLAAKPPGAVKSLANDSAASTSSSLKWTWVKPDETTTNNAATGYIYHVVKNTTTTPPASYTDWNGYIDGGNTQEITVSSLDANQDYNFWIRAFNADGHGPQGASTGKTKALSNPPGAPTSTALGDASPSGLGFSWAAGTGGTPDSYEVAYSTTTTVPTQIATGNQIDRWFDVGNVTSYRFTSLTESTTYYAWVRAKNADGTSGNGIRRNATTNGRPTVTNPSWTASANFQRLSYDHAARAVRRTANVGTTLGNVFVYPITTTTVDYVANASVVTTTGLGSGNNASGVTINAYTTDTNGLYIRYERSNTTSQNFTVLTTQGNIASNSAMRWGWANPTASPSTGTFAKVTPAGVQLEIYDAATGGNRVENVFRAVDTKSVTPGSVQGTEFANNYYAGVGSSINRTTASRWARLRAEAIDYDNKVWRAVDAQGNAQWTARI